MINNIVNEPNNRRETIGELIRSTLKQPETVFLLTINRTKENGNVTEEEVTVEVKKIEEALAIVDQMSQQKNKKSLRRLSSI